MSPPDSHDARLNNSSGKGRQMLDLAPTYSNNSSLNRNVSDGTPIGLREEFKNRLVYPVVLDRNDSAWSASVDESRFQNLEHSDTSLSRPLLNHSVL